MDATFGPAAEDLPQGAVRSYAGRAGGGIAVLEGRVWLTEPNDLRDHVLHAGESFAFTGRGPIVVEALGHASVLLRPTMEPRATPGARRLPGLVSTADGRPVLLRAVRATDAAALRTFIEGLSAAARYRRFHGWFKGLPDSVLQRMTRPDPRRELVLLALAIGAGHATCVGEARCAAGDGPATVREIAVVVDDAWQRVGLAAAMLRSLADEARARGVEQLVGDVLWENVATIGLAKRMGCRLQMNPSDARVLRVTCDLRGVGDDVEPRRFEVRP
ncbi:MAG TPA: GNAT family N-acetyltransferase [Caldimonas sp.]|nr:GNAT family N-acetyltransferase [Caldimonas sp.]